MSRFISLDEIVKTACLIEKDYQMQNKMRYLAFAKDIWHNDMNLTTVKDVKRIILEIDKRTNTVKLPCHNKLVSGVYVIGKFGEFYPVYRNERLHDDIVDISAIDDCDGHCCNKLCNMVKNYEAIEELIESEMPNGSTQTFTCITRKGYDNYGNYYEEKQYPQREYTDGTWTNTIVATEKINLCKLELDKKGCIKETDENYHLVLKHGCYGSCESLYVPKGEVGSSCIIDPSAKHLVGWECGYNFSAFNLNNSYNITTEGDRLVFPHNFAFKRILVRYYEDIKINDIKVPSIAKEAMMMGIKYYDTLLDENKLKINQVFAEKYARMKGGVMSMLMKVNKDQQRMALTPPVHIPNFTAPYSYQNSYI